MSQSNYKRTIYISVRCDFQMLMCGYIFIILGSTADTL